MAGANIEAIINADSNAPLKYSAFTKPPSTNELADHV
jgi:hypothetical protein